MINNEMKNQSRNTPIKKTEKKTELPKVENRKIISFPLYTQTMCTQMNE